MTYKEALTILENSDQYLSKECCNKYKTALDIAIQTLRAQVQFEYDRCNTTEHSSQAWINREDLYIELLAYIDDNGNKRRIPDVDIDGFPIRIDVKDVRRAILHAPAVSI